MQENSRVGIRFEVNTKELQEMNKAIQTIEKFNQASMKMSQSMNQTATAGAKNAQVIRNMSQEVDKIKSSTSAAGTSIENAKKSISAMEQATQKLTSQLKGYGRDVKVMVDSNGKMAATFKDVNGNIVKMKGELDSANGRFVNFSNSIQTTNNHLKQLAQAEKAAAQEQKKMAQEAAKAAQEMKKNEQYAESLTRAYNKLHQGVDLSNVLRMNNGQFDVYNNAIKGNSEIVRANIDRHGKFTQTLRDQQGALTTINGYYNQSHGRLIQYSEAVSSGNNKVAKSMRDAEQETKKGTNAMSEWANQTRIAFERMIQWTAVTTVFFQVVNGLKSIGSTIVEVDHQMTNLKRVMGEDQFMGATDSAAGFDRMLRTATSTAQELGVTVVGVLESMNEFARQGFDENTINYLSRMSTVFSKVADIDMSTSASYLTSAMKIFNLEAEQSIQIVDQLNQVDNDYAVSSDDLAQSLARAGGTANAFGVSLEQVLGHTVAIGEATRESGAIVGNSLKTIYSRITTVDAAISGLKSVGVNVFDNITKDSRNVNDILGDLAGKWGGLSKSQRENLGVTIAGRHQLSRFMVLMDRWPQAIKATDTAYHAAGSGMREYDKYMQSIDANMNLAIAAFQKLAISLGEAGIGAAMVAALKGVTMFTEGITFTVDKLGAVSFAIPAVVAALGFLGVAYANSARAAQTAGTALAVPMNRAGQAINNLAASMGASTTVAAGMGGAVSKLTTGLRTLAMVTIANPFFWVTAAVVGITSLIGGMSQAKQEVESMAESARNAEYEFDQLNKRIEESKDGANMQYDLNKLDGMRDKLKEVADGAKFTEAAFQNQKAALDNSAMSSINLGFKFTELKDNLMAKWNDTDSWFERLPSDLKKTAAELGVTYEKGMTFNEFIAQLDEKSIRATDSYNKLNEKIKQGGKPEGILEAAKAMNDLADNTEEAFSAFSKIAGFKDEMINSLKEQMTYISLMSKVPQEQRSALEDSGLKEAIGSVADRLKLGKDAADGMYNGNQKIIDQASSNISAFENVKKAVEDYTKAGNEKERQDAENRFKESRNIVASINERRVEADKALENAEIFKTAESVKRDELGRSIEQMRITGLISGELANELKQKIGYEVPQAFRDMGQGANDAQGKMQESAGQTSSRFETEYQKIQRILNGTAQTSEGMGQRIGGVDANLRTSAFENEQTYGRTNFSMQQNMNQTAGTSENAGGRVQGANSGMQGSINSTSNVFGIQLGGMGNNYNTFGQTSTNTAGTVGGSNSNIDRSTSGMSTNVQGYLKGVQNSNSDTGKSFGTMANDASSGSSSVHSSAKSGLGGAKGEADGLSKALDGLKSAWNGLKNLGSIALNFATGGLIGGGGAEGIRDLSTKVNKTKDFVKSGGGTASGVFSGLPITSQFGYRTDPFTGATAGHNGMDFAAPTGTPVRATTGGIVIKSGFGAYGSGYGGYGNVVAIQDMAGFVHIYGHNSGVNVPEGSFVGAGTVIASSGSTGRSTGPHIHYEVRRGGSAISPRPWVGGGNEGTRDLRKYHTGGIVDGSIVDDKFRRNNEVDTRLLKGEMVLTQSQQKNLFNMMKTPLEGDRKLKFHVGGVVGGMGGGNDWRRLAYDDSFEENDRTDPNRGKAGYVQAEDGSWVSSSFWDTPAPKIAATNVSPKRTTAYDKIYGSWSGSDYKATSNQFVTNNFYQGEYRDRVSSASYVKDIGAYSVNDMLWLMSNSIRGAANSDEDKKDYNKQIIDLLKQTNNVDYASRAFDNANLFLPEGVKELAKQDMLAVVRQNEVDAYADRTKKWLDDLISKMPKVNEQVTKFVDLHRSLNEENARYKEESFVNDFVNSNMQALGFTEKPTQLEALEEKMKDIQDRSKNLLEQNAKIKYNTNSLENAAQLAQYQKEFSAINDRLYQDRSYGKLMGYSEEQINNSTKELENQWKEAYARWEDLYNSIEGNKQIMSDNEKVLGSLSEQYKKLQEQMEETKKKTEIMEKIKDKVNAIFDWNASSLITEKTDEFGNVVRDVEGTVRAVLDVQKAINEVTKDIYDNIDKTVQEMITEIMTSQLPDLSKVFEQKGDYSGIEQGINGAIEKIKPTWNETLDYMAGSMTQMFNGQQWANVIGNWTNNMGQALNNFAPIMAGIFTQTSEVIAKTMTELPQMVNTAIQNITVGLFNTVIGILNHMVGLVNQIIPATQRIPAFEEMKYAKPTYTQNNQTNNEVQTHKADTNVYRNVTYVVQTGVAIASESELKEFAMVLKKMMDEEEERGN
ncbi:tail tape measure protein [Bacillus phage pW4]|uniref:Tail tape measure protein n=1 Tax=Bacillus phage pW4 TaxID=2500560 RepID=A0A3Q9R7R1_9CAUD|nr:tail length tape measure protein [Bacillus phage pW4]AZU99065.1 tail tape measure protein [Bacillus phage pW4]